MAASVFLRISGSLSKLQPSADCSYQEWHGFFYDAPHFCVLFTCVTLSKQLSAFFVVKDLEILLWNVLCVVSAAWRYGSFLEASQADLVVTFCKNSCQWNWTDWIWAGSWGVDVWYLDKNDVDVCFSFCRNTFWVDVTLWFFFWIYLYIYWLLWVCVSVWASSSWDAQRLWRVDRSPQGPLVQSVGSRSGGLRDGGIWELPGPGIELCPVHCKAAS